MDAPETSSEDGGQDEKEGAKLPKITLNLLFSLAQRVVPEAEAF